MWRRDRAGGSAERTRRAAASEAGSCGATGRWGTGASGAGPSLKYRSASVSSFFSSQPAAARKRLYCARRSASSPAASSGSRSSKGASSSSGKSPRALSSRREATSTRNSPSTSRSSRRSSRNVRTISTISTSARSSSSFRTRVRSRSKGPSKASRSSGSSATALTGVRIWLAADAAFGDAHLRPLRRCCGPRARGPLLPPLRPDEGSDREHEEDERDVEVEAQAEVLVRGIDPKELLVRAKGGVPGDVEREEAWRPDSETAFDQEQHSHAEQVPERLVEEERVKGLLADVPLRTVLHVDL